MFTYSPEKFASLYASELGQRIWAFLTRPENVARLETASELGKPAVEGIGLVEADAVVEPVTGGDECGGLGRAEAVQVQAQLNQH